MTVRAMFHILHGVVGYFHMSEFAQAEFSLQHHKNQTNSHQNTHADRLHASSWNRRAQLVFSRRCRQNRILYGSHKHFSVFCINYIFMSFFATYVWLTVSKHQHRKPAALRAVYALSVIGILLLIITQFTGLFYYFDDHNLYHRGNFYLLSQAIAVLGIALCFFMLISYRKNLDRIIFLSMMSFFVLPVLATIYQALAYSFSLQCLAIVISTQIMFVMDTVEMNMRFHSQQAAYEKARYEAEHDGMTGLLNKEAGWKHMRKYFDRMDSHDEAMLMFVDIDDFKTINDTYGHTVGDFWIREVASQLRHIYRQDDIICRYGGDEFIALIRNTASEQVLETTLGMFFQQLHAPRNSTGKTCIAVWACAVLQPLTVPALARGAPMETRSEAWISANASHRPTWRCTKPNDSTKERSPSTTTTVPSQHPQISAPK